MGFAVELHIDPINTAPIVALTQQIYAQCGGQHLTGMGAHPHISLTLFAQLDPASIDGLLAEFAATTPPLSVAFASVGVFTTAQGIVYLAPVVTAQLLAVHTRFHRLLDQLAIPSNAYYLPDRWVPHCTVGIELPPDKIGLAVTLCQAADVFRAVTLTTLRLIEFHPARPIYTYQLQGA